MCSVDPGSLLEDKQSATLDWMVICVLLKVRKLYFFFVIVSKCKTSTLDIMMNEGWRFPPPPKKKKKKKKKKKLMNKN